MLLKPESKKKLVIFYIVIGLLLLFNNLLLPKLNKKKYSFEGFASEFCDAGDKKTVTDSSAGYLAYGPYIGCDKGRLQIEIFYNADSSGNTVDIYSGQYQQVFSQIELPEDQTRVMLDADIPFDLADTEFRVYYGGNGTLEIDKLVLSERIDDLHIIMLIYDIVLAAAGIITAVFAARKKEKRT